MATARYMITDRRLAGGQDALLASVRLRLIEGIEYIQIREKDWAARELYEFTRAVLDFPRGATKIIVNGRLDVALAAGAQGVHLPAGSSEARVLRPLCPTGFEIGVSCHEVDEVLRAGDSGMDYCLFAPIFAPLSKSDSRLPHGIEVLRKAVRLATVPVFALGGVTRERLKEVQDAGAGAAGITLFL